LALYSPTVKGILEDRETELPSREGGRGEKGGRKNSEERAGRPERIIKRKRIPQTIRRGGKIIQRKVGPKGKDARKDAKLRVRGGFQ